MPQEVFWGFAVWESNNRAAVKQAIRDGYNPNYCDNDGCTALHKCAKRGYILSLKALLRAPITRVDVVDHWGRTPLHYAAKCEDRRLAIEAAKLLIAHNVPIDGQSALNSEFTALFVAVREGNLELAEYLLQAGADIKLQNSGVTALTCLTDMQWMQGRSGEIDFLKNHVAMMLYYNADVNACEFFPNHPIWLFGLQMRTLDLYFMLVDYCVGIECPRDTLCAILRGTDIISSMTEEMIINLINTFKWETRESFALCLCSGFAREGKLFNYFYSKCLETGGANESVTESYNLYNFFQSNNMSKKVFLECVEKLLDNNLNVQWDVHYFSMAYDMLFRTLRKKLKLNFDDMQTIVTLMVLQVDIIAFLYLQSIYEEISFTPEFELFLQYDICVRFTGEIVVHNQRVLTLRGSPKRRITGVDSLQRMCINAIRQQMPRFRLLDSSTNTYQCFRNYWSVENLRIPKSIKKMILLD